MAISTLHVVYDSAQDDKDCVTYVVDVAGAEFLEAVLQTDERRPTVPVHRPALQHQLVPKPPL